MISRFRSLYATEAEKDDIEWPDLFAEFSKEKPFLGGNTHPGWSPAGFEPAGRELANVRRIDALVLDYDNKTKAGDRVTEPLTVEAAAELFGDYYGFIHTTRHHTKDWPRFRVILPLDRSVDRLGYSLLWAAAARRWPGLDPQPKDPSRFWYVPGVADQPGAEFKAVTMAGGFLDPDQFVEETPAILAPSAPPSGETDEVRESRARAYIEKMPAAISGQGGHAALWAVVRKLVCDFALEEPAVMRILKSEYNPRCQPPWSDKDLRHKISDALTKARVVNPIADRPMAETPQQAQIIPIHQTEVVTKKDDWRKYLHHDQRDRLTKGPGNVTLILKNADGFAGCLRYNEMAGYIYWHKEPHYHIGIDAPRMGETLSDHHVPYVQHVMLTLFGLEVGKDTVWSAMNAAAHESPIHPVQEYFKSITWDGKPRVAKWLHTYLGCEDNIYNNSVGKWWLISAVARAMTPGCQADHVLILEGKQGKGKSQAIKALGKPWVLESLPNLQDNAKAVEAIGGMWLVEIAELDALKGPSMTRVKDFVTQQVDKYRPPYDRATISRPRSCVFIGTTNEAVYLNDPTGARRFWPVKLKGRIYRKRLEEERDQLWAEAKMMLDNGEQWHPTEEMLDLIAEEQSDRYIEDDWTGVIKRWIDAHDVETTGFTSEEILGQALNIEMRLWDRSTQTRVGAILTKLGYEKRRQRSGGGARANKYFPAG